MKTKLALGIAALGMVLASVPAIAHHSFAAEFDSTKPIKMTGSVTKIEWMNPHAVLLHRREGRQRQGHELGARDGQPERPDAPGLDAQLDEDR